MVYQQRKLMLYVLRKPIVYTLKNQWSICFEQINSTNRWNLNRSYHTVSVKQGLMAMMWYLTLRRFTELEPYHQMQMSILRRTRFFFKNGSAKQEAQYYVAYRVKTVWSLNQTFLCLSLSVCLSLSLYIYIYIHMYKEQKWLDKQEYFFLSS